MDTLGQGLVDGLFEARVSPSRCIDVQVAAHAFFASNLIENWVPPEEELREPGQAFYGVEVDGLIRWKPVSVYTLTGGAYVFVPGGLYGQDAKADFGGYLMSDIHFK